MSPVVMIVSSCLLLLSSDKYGKIEDVLGKDLGGIKKKTVPLLEKNIDFLQKWMLKYKKITGLVFIFCALLIFCFSKK
jgi:hypothetical protein